jgi:hypothetical protein
LQREAAERGAEADKTRPEKERGLALATAAVNRRRSRIAIVGALAAVVVGLVAAPQTMSAVNRVNRLATTAQAAELATTVESLAKDFPGQGLMLAREARRMDPVPKANALLRAADAAYPYRVALRGHTGGVVSAQFSANGKTMLTASLDKTARLWDVASAKELRALRGHADRVVNAQFSADERRLPGPAAGPVRSRLDEEAVAAQDSSPSGARSGADARVRPGDARSPGSPAADRRGGRMSPTRVAAKEPRQQILSVLCASLRAPGWTRDARLHFEILHDKRSLDTPSGYT